MVNRLKLCQSTKRKLECYEEIFAIGARVDMKWTEEDLSETDWPAGKQNKRLILCHMNTSKPLILHLRL